MKTALALIFAGIFIACSSDPSPSSSGGVLPGSTTSSSSSGSSGAIPGSSSGDPAETVSCDSATVQESCAIDAIPAYDVALTTDASCKTSLYLVGAPTEEASGVSGEIIRRYTLKTIKPCVFERDTTFADAPGAAVIAADDAGDVLTVDTNKHAVLIKGGQTITCTGTFRGASKAALARDGSVGYLGYYSYENSKPINLGISKVTITGMTCSVADLPLTGDPLTGINGLALDTKGRLHVSDQANFPPSNNRVDIYGPDGAFVSSYIANEAAGYFSPESMTACKGGICVDGFGSLVSFDENGVTRNSARHQVISSISGSWYLGTPRGPIFYIGDSYERPQRLIVETVVQP